MKDINAIVAHIKRKKELASLDDAYVKEKVAAALTEKILAKFEKAKDIVQFAKSKEYDELRSLVRKELRATYGVFQDGAKEREKLCEQYLETKDVYTLRKILATHQSTKERITYYTKFYRELFTRLGAANTILDLGCGLNPVSYTFAPKCTWIATDISSQDITFLSSFFKKTQLAASAHVLDALNHDAVLAVVREHKPDAVLLLKLVNTLENMQRHTSKKLLAALGEEVQYLVVSFATQSLGGGKTISANSRMWFENFLKKTTWKHDTFEVPNEIIYVVTTR